MTALHTGSLALALAPGAQVLEDLLDREHRRDGRTISIDLNLRPSIVTDRAAEQARVRRQVPLAHLVKASDEDLAWLYPDRSVAEVMAEWREAGVSCAVVTRGGEGALLLAPNGSLHEEPAVRTTVVDTVGAGDSFTGGLLAALADLDALGDRPADRLAAVTEQQWRRGAAAGRDGGRADLRSPRRRPAQPCRAGHPAQRRKLNPDLAGPTPSGPGQRGRRRVGQRCRGGVGPGGAGWWGGRGGRWGSSSPAIRWNSRSVATRASSRVS